MTREDLMNKQSIFIPSSKDELRARMLLEQTCGIMQLGPRYIDPIQIKLDINAKNNSDISYFTYRVCNEQDLQEWDNINELVLNKEWIRVTDYLATHNKTIMFLNRNDLDYLLNHCYD